MKILMLLLFVSFFEVYAQASKNDKSPNAKVWNDNVVPGQSIEARRVNKPGSMQATRTGSSIRGTTCMDARGKEFIPTDKGYRKCVDNANRR